MTAAQRSYQAVLRAIKSANPDLSHKQAQAAWRGIKDRLGAAPTKAQLKSHPRITKEEVKRAPARERAQRSAETRARNKAAAAAKEKPAPAARPKKPAAKEPAPAAAKPKRETAAQRKQREQRMAEEKRKEAAAAAPKKRKSEAQRNWDELDAGFVEIEDPTEDYFGTE